MFKSFLQVRHECVHLAGIFSLSEADKENAKLLKNLKAERKRLQRQVEVLNVTYKDDCVFFFSSTIV